ncbi:MAG: hypothetical protein FWG85_06805 [Bacteroidetes bacterium]|nr:hypothetical protein [Bacteroidota bacterium]
METLEVKVLNPQAKQLLLELETLKLISIKEANYKVMELLESLRKKTEIYPVPTFEEITKEVEKVREERYASEQAT